MAERRALIEGLSPVEDIDRQLEEEFVYNKPKTRKAAKAPAAAPALPEATNEQPPAPAPVTPAQPATEPANAYAFLGAGRIAIGARVRPELASALKRTSLERQLKGVEPNAVQDILEEALELWLHKQGLL